MSSDRDESNIRRAPNSLRSSSSCFWTRVNGLEVSYGEVKGFIHLQDFQTLKTSIEDFSAEQEVNSTL